MLSQLILLYLLSWPCLGCPDLWTPSGGSCYKVSSEPMSWYQSEQYCGQEGGYMAEIRDADEQASLFSFLPTDINYWIGLTDLAYEGEYVWQTDFTETNYTYWKDGEPNDAENTDVEADCVHLWDNFQWNDRNCRDDNMGTLPTYIHALCETEDL